MNITPAVKESHEALSTYNIKFLEYVEKNPACLERSQFREIVEWAHPLSVTYRNLQPWPLFISRETREAFAETSIEVFNLIKSIPRRLFSNDPSLIARYYTLTENSVQSCLHGTNEEHMKGLVGRGDFFVSPSGLKCIEFNIASGIGGWELPVWEPMYLRNPLIAEFVKSREVKILNKNLFFILFEHLINSTLKWFPHEDEINIAFTIYNREVLASVSTLRELFNQQFVNALKRNKEKKKLKGKLIFSLIDKLDVVGESLYYQGNKVHTLIHGFLSNPPLEILNLFRLRKLLIYNGPVTPIMANKFSISLLSEHEDSHLFTPAERETIKKYIPWTRKVIHGSTSYGSRQIDLEDFIIANKDRLVLKPSMGLGGEDVHIGLYTPERQWEELVENALAQKQFVVQERIESLPYLYQWGENGCVEFDAAWGMMVFGQSYGGVLLRVLPREKSKGVINVHQGAEVPVVFEVEE